MVRATVRPAAVSDAAAIARIYVETWRDAYPGMLPDRVLVGLEPARQARAWRRTIADPRQHVLVAVAGAGGVAGFGSCGPARRDLPFSGEIYTLYVASEHQRQGIGRLLLDRLLADLIGAGHRSAVVWALADNPSRFFYEAMGARMAAEGEEQLWGTAVRQRAYAWADLASRLKRRPPQGR
jgi:ribosomal protein S18 acetylase RimI-like enzyme